MTISDILKCTALVTAFTVSSPQAGEHWVCSSPHKLEPTRTVIMDYEVDGDKLRVSGVEYPIIRNDDSLLIAVHAAKAPIPDDMGQVVGIDKRTGRYKYIDVFFG